MLLDVMSRMGTTSLTLVATISNLASGNSKHREEVLETKELVQIWQGVCVFFGAQSVYLSDEKLR